MGYQNHLKTLLSMNFSEKQRAFYQWQHDVTQEVDMHPLESLGMDPRINAAWVARRCEQKQCYKNASLVCQAAEGVEYVEGILMLYGQIPIDHAWNVYQGKHFDVTQEFILGGNKTGMDRHWKLVQVDKPELQRIMLRTKVYGDVVQQYFRSHIAR